MNTSTNEAELSEALALAERATDAAERYGNAIIEISAALSQHASGGGVMRARTIIAGLDSETA